MVALKSMPAFAKGGRLNASVVVIHCTESDNTPAMAESLAGPGWFGGPKAGTSAHKMIDVDSGVEMVARTVVAFHAGPRGNTVGISYEFCGRAGWSAAKWREPAQLQMLRNAAPSIAADLRAIGADNRWLSLAQLAGGQRGLCTHNDIRLALGGTTHSDPGPNFPYAELVAYVAAELRGDPTSTAPTTQEDFMAKLTDQQQTDLYNAVDRMNTEPDLFIFRDTTGRIWAASVGTFTRTEIARESDVPGIIYWQGQLGRVVRGCIVTSTGVKWTEPAIADPAALGALVA